MGGLEQEDEYLVAFTVRVACHVWQRVAIELFLQHVDGFIVHVGASLHAFCHDRGQEHAVDTEEEGSEVPMVIAFRAQDWCA